jgi:hypothetical protein
MCLVSSTGDDHQVYKVASNILNKKVLTANSGWLSSLSCPFTVSVYRNLCLAPGFSITDFKPLGYVSTVNL